MSRRLVEAVGNEDLQLIKQYIREGDAVNYKNDLLIRNAAIIGNLDLVKVLHNAGADISIYVERPLYISVVRGHLNLVKYFHKEGLDIHIHEDEYLTIAKQFNHFDIYEYILDN